MFSSKNRLDNESVRNILKNNVGAINTPLFYAKRIKNDLNLYRFAILIPKKIYKKAVDRHKIKRKIISIIKEFEDISKCDYVLTLKKDINSLDKTEIQKDLVKIVN
ncbi:MAG TPA: ribonuclease P protein component [Candidatus Paceibacterota bacterium]|nr:ribonuclease P protein component [Candidatus Paceibacterota bacterium]HMP18990.1 ribonuclease P protein component [Candidatus Paceibacterota bacterium]HMP85235.1 ribonuclease P protein component [Candidatus Paceibacterota bacterium]